MVLCLYTTVRGTARSLNVPSSKWQAVTVTCARPFRRLYGHRIQRHRASAANHTSQATQEPRESRGPQRIPLASTHSTGPLPSISSRAPAIPPPHHPARVLRCVTHLSSGRRRLVHFPQLLLFHPPPPPIIPHRFLRAAPPARCSPSPPSPSSSPSCSVASSSTSTPRPPSPPPLRTTSSPPSAAPVLLQSISHAEVSPKIRQQQPGLPAPR